MHVFLHISYRIANEQERRCINLGKAITFVIKDCSFLVEKCDKSDNHRC